MPIIICFYLRVKGEEWDRQQRQVNTLLKTLFLLTSVRLNIFILNNDDAAFNSMVSGVQSWGVKTDHLLK